MVTLPKLIWQFDESVAPHQEARPPPDLPVVVYQIQPVVAVARARRMGRLVTLAPDDPHRKTIQAAVGQSPVPQTEGLIGDLASSIRVPASVPGVDDQITEILVVLVAAGQDDRVRSLARAARDSRLTVSVHASLRQLGTILEEAANRISRYVSEDRSGHSSILPRCSVWSYCYSRA